MKARNWTMERLEREPDYEEYYDPKVPFCFMWMYNSFIELYNMAGESITWTEIESYANIRSIKFTQIEVDYIFKMNQWANGMISEMKEQEL